MSAAPLARHAAARLFSFRCVTWDGGQLLLKFKVVSAAPLARHRRQLDASFRLPPVTWEAKGRLRRSHLGLTNSPAHPVGINLISHP